MITEYNITDYINEYAYELYNRKPINWEKRDEILAEIADREYEDNFEEED